MLRLFRIANGLIDEIAEADDGVDADIAAAEWIDAHEPDHAERQHLQRLLGTDVPELEDVEEIEASARCFIDAAGIHLHSLFLSQSEGRAITLSVACILQPGRLLTIREGEIPDFRLLRLRARRGQVACQTPTELLVTIFEQKVENLADNLEDIHKRLEKVSHLALEDESADLEDCISQLAQLEDSNGKIRLCLMDTQRDIAYLQRHLRDKPALQEDARDILRDIDALLSHTTFLFDKINFLMVSTQGFISIKQSQIIKIFSIAAVVFLPPTLVASIYGMNFRVMPELDLWFGYPLAIGLMVAAGVAPYLLFKRKGWL